MAIRVFVLAKSFAMTKSSLERSARSYGYEVSEAHCVNGSLVDYCLEKGGQRILVLVRDEFREEDLSYLSGVGTPWDKRVYLSKEPCPSRELFRIAKGYNIVLADSIDAVPFDQSGAGQPMGERSLTLVNEIAELSWNARLVLILIAAWREVAAIFVLGVLFAVFMKDYIYPWVLLLIEKSLKP